METSLQVKKHCIENLKISDLLVEAAKTVGKCFQEHEKFDRAESQKFTRY